MKVFGIAELNDCEGQGVVNGSKFENGGDNGGCCSIERAKSSRNPLRSGPWREISETLQSFICLFTLHQGNCRCLPSQPALQDSSPLFNPSLGQLCGTRIPRLNHPSARDFHGHHIHQTSSHFAVQQRVSLSNQEASLYQQLPRHMNLIPELKALADADCV